MRDPHAAHVADQMLWLITELLAKCEIERATRFEKLLVREPYQAQDGCWYTVVQLGPVCLLSEPEDSPQNAEIAGFAVAIDYLPEGISWPR